MEALYQQAVGRSRVHPDLIEEIARRRDLSTIDTYIIVLSSDDELRRFLTTRSADDMLTLPRAVVERICTMRSGDKAVLQLLMQTPYTAELVNWTAVSTHWVLSACDIYEMQERLDWPALCRHQDLKPSTIAQHKEFVCWPTVCRYQQMPLKFLREHQHLVDWRIVSKYQYLTSEGIWEFRDRVHWRRVAKHQHMTAKLARRIFTWLDWSSGVSSTGLLDNKHLVIGPDLFSDMVNAGHTTLVDVNTLKFTSGQVHAVLRLLTK